MHIHGVGDELPFSCYEIQDLVIVFLETKHRLRIYTVHKSFDQVQTLKKWTLRPGLNFSTRENDYTLK